MPAREIRLGIEALEGREMFAIDLSRMLIAPVAAVATLAADSNAIALSSTYPNQQMYLGPARDAQNQLITYSLDMPPEYGSVSIEGNLATYIPDPLHPGVYSFTVMSSANGNTITSDSDYLYDTQTRIYTRADGTQNFDVSYNGVVLRQGSATEKFFAIKDAGLIVTYRIEQREGGVDVIYTMTNPTANPLRHAAITIPGFMLGSPDRLEPVSMKPPGLDSTAFRYSTVNGKDYAVIRSNSYPEEAYSPAVIVKGPQYAVGVSLLYDYNASWTSSTVQLRQDPSGSWFFEAGSFYQHRWVTSDPTRLAPGETRTYTAAIRWSPPRDWLFTLAPYKEHYQQEFGQITETVADRDLRPIKAYTLSNVANITPDNPRGYDAEIWNRVQIAGQTGDPNTRDYDWAPALEFIRDSLLDEGFERVMIWSIAGAFTDPDSNYPPISGTTWLPGLEDDRQDWLDILGDDSGIELGVYLGQSAKVPVMNQDGSWDWDAPLERFDYDNPQHLAFMRAEINAILGLGADEIGLDAPNHMTFDDRERLWDEMFALKPNLKLLIESETADFGHRRAGNWLNQNQLEYGPNAIMWYLNPGSETYVKMSTDVSREDLEQLIRWGYTPVVFHNHHDLHDLDYEALRPVVNYNGISMDGRTIQPPVRNGSPRAFYLVVGGAADIPLFVIPTGEPTSSMASELGSASRSTGDLAAVQQSSASSSHRTSAEYAATSAPASEKEESSEANEEEVDSSLSASAIQVHVADPATSGAHTELSESLDWDSDADQGVQPIGTEGELAADLVFAGWSLISHY